MLNDLIKFANEAGLSLVPVIGIGCRGLIREDGGIERGAQNLPGNWESGRSASGNPLGNSNSRRA
jgi:hypothetical protein